MKWKTGSGITPNISWYQLFATLSSTVRRILCVQRLLPLFIFQSLFLITSVILIRKPGGGGGGV